MQLVNMARTEEDKRKEQAEWDKPSTENMEDYPYGLCIHLDNAAVEKLGLAEKDFDAGQPVSVQAIGMITSDSVTTVNGNKRRSFTIQLQQIAVEQEKPATDAVGALYGAE